MRVQDLWQLTACVMLGYIAVSLIFAFLLYPAYLWDPASFSGEPGEHVGMPSAIFCMSLGALSQTAISLTEVAPASLYTITVVVVEHFVGAYPPCVAHTWPLRKTV
jgi:hypothetical protein